MFLVGNGRYMRELSCRVFFHNKHKIFYNLFSPNPAVSCVDDKPVSHPEIYTLCSNLLHFI